jgi:uncharacterized membrane protein YsdA (DUF1294 family)
MKIKNVEVLPIVLFYAIAIALRLAWLFVAEYGNPAFHESYLFSLASGLGPIVGAIVTMAIFKKKTQCSLFGKSAWKSVLTIVVPCIAMFIVGGWESAWILFIPFVYGYLENMDGVDTSKMNLNHCLIGWHALSSL